MAEERPSPSLKKPPKPKSPQPEKPQRISAVEGKEMRIPPKKPSLSHPSLSAFSWQCSTLSDFRVYHARQHFGSASPTASELSLFSVSDDPPEVPKSPSSHEIEDLESYAQSHGNLPTTSTPLPSQSSPPTTLLSVTSTSVKVSTDHVRKYPPPSRPLKPPSIEEKPRLIQSPPPNPEQLESKPIPIQHTDTAVGDSSAAKSEGSKPAGSTSKQPHRAASISSGAVAKKIGKELDQKQGEFFHVTQLTKEMKPPPEVS